MAQTKFRYGPIIGMMVLSIIILIAVYWKISTVAITLDLKTFGFPNNYSEYRHWSEEDLNDTKNVHIIICPPHDRPLSIDFNQNKIKIRDPYFFDHNHTANKDQISADLTNYVILRRDKEFKSRGVMLKESSLNATKWTSLWNSDIKIWSCFQQVDGLNCEIWFNASNANETDTIMEHDEGAIKNSIKFYFPWFWTRKTNPNTYINRTNPIARDRGMEFIIIDASKFKGNFSAEVIYWF